MFPKLGYVCNNFCVTVTVSVLRKVSIKSPELGLIFEPQIS